MESIDFVIPWVDGRDLEWKAEKKRYEFNADDNTDKREERYRDWDILQYWFRGVEKFAPWVHRVYFITCGHVPSWLNLDAPKLVHVKHMDYMPEDYLPTFSSHPIELNIYRIRDLSEHIVYFNDDMFITRPILPDLFFKNGLPVHPARLHSIMPEAYDTVMPHVYINNVASINRHFSIKKSLRNNFSKWFSLRKSGIAAIIGNFYLSHHRQFIGFYHEHLPSPFLKTTLQTVWEKEFTLLDSTSKHRFRDMRDVNQWLFRYWELASGNFEPIRYQKLGEYYEILPDTSPFCSAIRLQKYPMICLNDTGHISSPQEFERVQQDIANAFEKILPEKSSFEK